MNSHLFPLFLWDFLDKQMICMMVMSSPPFHELCNPMVLTWDLPLDETASEVLG